MAMYLDALRRTALPVAAAPKTHIWTEPFDTTLLVAPLIAGLAAAAIVTADQSLYPILLVADLWLLGYHHVIATYTRLAFDGQSLRRNRFLAVDLLLVVTAVTLLVAMSAGVWVIVSAFLYLQWFHYMRQGYGIARMYFRATPQGQLPGARDWAADLVIYLVPIYGIAARSASMGTQFLGLPVRALAVPDAAVTLAGIFAAAAVAVWFLRTVRATLNDTVDVPYTCFILSHVAIFMLAYVVIADVNTGWLAINVWHNFQYVLVVWMANAKRYAHGIDPSARLLSRISQPGRAVAYFVTCVGITTLVYGLLNRFTVLVLGGGMGLTVGTYMGINFHHYVVDALIWKRRKTATV
ncbi:MAG TPA: hypothetical protein VH436_35405 [Vicinamibacterales bacterium]